MTTADLVDCERRLIATAVDRADERCAVVPTAAIDRAITGVDRPLTDEQEQVVRGCASSGNGVDVVEALAGTGKTYTAGVLRLLYESAGYQVLGLAPTGRGARELADEAGISALHDRPSADRHRGDRRRPPVGAQSSSLMRPAWLRLALPHACSTTLRAPAAK